MPNPWDNDPVATQARPNQQQQPRVRPVFTAPPKTPDPMEQQRMQNEQERLRMAQEDQARQASKEQRDAQKDALDIEKRRRDLAPAAEGTEAERTAAFLTTRVAGGLSELGRLRKADPSAMRPTWGVEAVRTVLGDTAANYLTDTERQQVIAAQTDMVDALLTLGTGAAYTKEQIEGYRRAYFPQLGDDAATVDAKQQKLRLALEAARVKAGRSAGQIDAAMEAAGLSQPGQPVDNQNDGAFVGGSAASDPNNPPPPGRPSPEQLKAQYPDAQKFLFDDQGNISGIINSEGQFEQIIEVTPDSQNGTLGQEFLSGVGDVVETAGDTLGLIGNPLNAGVNAVFGTSLSTDLGQSLRDATGLPDISNPYAKAITQGGVGAMAGTGIAQGASGLVTSGVGRGVINSLLANPGRQVVAGGAAGLSSETARQSGAGPVGQIAAGILGGGVALGGTNALLNASRPKASNALSQAATRQSVDLMPADAGGALTRRLSGGAVQMPVASGQMVRGAERTQAQLKSAAARASGSQGDVANTDAAGEALRTAGKNMATRSSAKGARLYERAEKASQGIRSIKPLGALSVIDDNIARLSELKQTNAPLVKELSKLRSDIAKGISVSGLRDARTALSQGTYDGKLRSGQEKAIYKQIIAALSQDVESGLISAGKQDAARAFKTADAYWKARVEHIDEVLEPIIGGQKGGEEIVGAVEAMARGSRGGNIRLSRLLSELDPKEAGDIRALMIDRLGKATAGAQGAEGDAFSSATFLTNWNKMTPQAKTSLFGNRELRSNLDDIAQIAEATKASQKFNNTSNTAGAVNGAALGATAIANPPVAAAILTSQYLTGRLLSSPTFARFLARAPKTNNPSANRKYIEQLSVLAAREPVIANDARALQKALTDAFSQSPMRAAATGDQEPDRRLEPPAQ